MFALRTAIKMARCSNSPQFPTGAVAFKGGAIIGFGKNNYKKTDSFSKSRHKKLHAEEALAKRFNLIGASVIVVRITRSGNLGLAKPCPTCERLLREKGVKRIYYTNKNGIIEEV